jgi:hypothetical protein
VIRRFEIESDRPFHQTFNPDQYAGQVTAIRFLGMPISRSR